MSLNFNSDAGLKIAHRRNAEDQQRATQGRIARRRADAPERERRSRVSAWRVTKRATLVALAFLVTTVLGAGAASADVTGPRHDLLGGRLRPFDPHHLHVATTSSTSLWVPALVVAGSAVLALISWRFGRQVQVRERGQKTWRAQSHA
ncbi:MAG: hypothetical protein ACXVXC_05810 [Nocardioidaceae bacterium]